jgi:hypothetical protein
MLTQLMTWQLVVDTQGDSILAAGTASAVHLARRLTSSSSTSRVWRLLLLLRAQLQVLMHLQVCSQQVGGRCRSVARHGSSCSV